MLGSLFGNNWFRSSQALLSPEPQTFFAPKYSGEMNKLVFSGNFAKRQGALMWLLNFCNAGTATKGADLFPLPGGPVSSRAKRRAGEIWNELEKNKRTLRTASLPKFAILASLRLFNLSPRRSSRKSRKNHKLQQL